MDTPTKSQDCWNTKKKEVFFKNFVMKLAEIFYSIEDYFIVQMIVKGEEVSEQLLLERFKMDLKTVRERIATLNKDCIISTRHVYEKDEKGKKRKEILYSINYKKFFNVAVFKFKWIADKLKKNEIESVAIPFFKCTNEVYCQKKFFELEALELYNDKEETFTCTYCDSEVVENVTDLSPRSTVAGYLEFSLDYDFFNKEMEEAFLLTKKIMQK